MRQAVPRLFLLLSALPLGLARVQGSVCMKDRCAYCVAIIRSDPEGRELPVADTNLGEPSSSALLPPKAQDYANERAAHLGVAVPTKNVVHRKKCYDAVKRENEAVRQEQSLQRLTRN